MANRLLLIEDDAHSGEQLSAYYRKQGWQVQMATDVMLARKYLLEKEYDPHIIITDLSFPDGSILDVLEDLRGVKSTTEWIFILEDSDEIDTERIDEMTYDFLIKPFEQKRLDMVVKRALRAALTHRRLLAYTNIDHQRYHIDSYLGTSDPVNALKSLLKQLTQVPISTLIITGETGTGKGLVARIIHHCGLRNGGSMVELNCAALPKDLLESQLFGHEVGAFTGAKTRHRGLFEQADGGTLFLDEIGDMDIDIQAKVLKAIEDKKIRRLGSEREIEVDVQIIVATSVDLAQACHDGAFRSDLYHRLSVFCVNLPPLRERKSDLMDLVPRILAEYNAKANKKIDDITDTVWDKLLGYDWPGNVRELRNVIERCVLLSTDDTLTSKWLQLEENTISITTDDAPAINQSLSLPLDGSMTLDEIDRFVIQTALERNEYNVTETARILGATRETLRYRIQKYQIKIPA